MDLPAKASVLNIKQFNGSFGCLTCNHPGESSKNLKKWIYPYKTKVNIVLYLLAYFYIIFYKFFLCKFECISDRDYKIYAEAAEKSNAPFFGVKGSNCFIDLLDIPSQIPFDYMHLSLQGHARWLNHQLFFNKKSKFYIGKCFST